ncbi:MAG: pyridoxal 5'-phosphate synthase glutaminase subunit PdxT [Dehalococcoidales bacterium]|nr:pyridoxal 5'-phosphate synthase glutaminase subunit PdxT [Dehalococcoidales bacterium]
MKIGVLALQGAFAEHIAVLRKLGVEAVEVRLPEQLEGLDGLIIPGGESTTFTILMKAYQFADAIIRLAKNNFPIFGTCAGMIVLANGLINNGGVEPVGAMSIKVKRNAFGRQVDSFEVGLSIPALGKKPFPGVFIRAPRIESAGRNVEVLAKLDDGTIVAARQGKILVTSFHPELTDDTRLHRYFLDIVSGKQ